jgi:crossover junction endodeoxyribonuclease RuvC
MRVLGIDPGTRHLGWGVLERVGTKIRHLAHGVIDTDAKASLEHRLVAIDDALIEVIATYAPAQAAVEAIFFAKDAQAASKLGHARGVVLLRLARARVPSFEYAPTRVKRAVVGAGQASKEQVQRVMTTLLGLAEAPRLDASDALANAFAHLAVARFHEAVEASTGGASSASPAAKLLAAAEAARKAAKRARTRRG